MLFSAGTSALLATFFRVKENPRLTMAWRLTMVSTCIWSLGRAFMALSSSPVGAMAWLRVSYLGSIWLAPLWLWVAHELTGRRVNRVWFWAMGSLSGVFCVANFTPWFIGQVTPKLDFLYYDDAPGILFEIWSTIFTILLIWAHILVFRQIRQSQGHHRNRLLAFFVSGLVGFGGSSTTFPLVKDIGLYPFGVLGVSLSTVLMSYAVVKHHVMDVNLAFRYGAMWFGYAVLGAVLAVCPFIILGAKLTPAWAVSTLLAVGGGPFLYRLVMPMIASLVDRLPWFRGRYLSRQAVRDVLMPLRGIENLDQLPWAMVDRVKALVPARSCSVLLKDAGTPRFLVKAHFGLDTGQAVFLSMPSEGPLARQLRRETSAVVAEFLDGGPEGAGEIDLIRKEMEFLQAAVALPIFFRGDLHAVVAIAEREDGRAYNDVDIGYLNELAQRSEHRMETLIAGLTHQQMTSMWAHDLAKPFGPKGSFHYLSMALGGAYGELPAQIKDVLQMLDNDVQFVHKNLHQVLKPTNMNVFYIIPNTMENPYMWIREKYKIEALRLGINWIVDVPPRDVMVLCDAPMIEHRVLANLVENAFRYTPEGGMVKLGYTLTQKEFIGFVQDTGIGIRKEDLPKMFQPWVQLDENNRGLAGLGLASVRSVIEPHRGRVWVESEAGVGSTFYFSLPLDKKVM